MHGPNVCENAFRLLAKRKGWAADKRGWPDFFCVSRCCACGVPKTRRKTVNGLD